MNKSKSFLPIFITLAFAQAGFSQSGKEYSLPEPVMVELNRLEEAYTILDQFSEKVWTGWTDYLNFPFLFNFQDGLRVLVGHPAPPEGFVLYAKIMVHGLKVHIDTTKCTDYKVQLPLRCGGGVIPYGNFSNQSVLIVNLNLINASDTESGENPYLSAEDHILVFIHELMHCYQKKIMPNSYGNLHLNPDLNHALYSEIEGLALIKAFEQNSVEDAMPFLKDFCLARNQKFTGMTQNEVLQARCDEFREGEAVYSEFMILQCLKNGFKNTLSPDQDPGYNRFEDIENYENRYPKRLREISGKTLELYEKNYVYGCFQALMLQKYFPGWQKDIEAGSWLDPILRAKLAITQSDSLQTLKRFNTIYGIDNLRAKHEKTVNGRNETYHAFISREGQIYVINFKPIKQYLPDCIDKTKTCYKLGLMEMFPEGIGTIRFDEISLKLNPVPVEVNQLYFVKVVDTKPNRHKKPYKIDYLSKDQDGIYYNVIITTPMFTLNAPKVEIREKGNRVKFTILSRT